jgi:hypothetical protein
MRRNAMAGLIQQIGNIAKAKEITPMTPSVYEKSQLVGWLIGMPLVLAMVVLVDYRIWASDYDLRVQTEPGELTVIPIVYLVFLHLTLVSQEWAPGLRMLR